MCVSVLPETSHLPDRYPLTPSKPLPWPKCYHLTLGSFFARVSTEMVDCAEGIIRKQKIPVS
ncbi:hypothetical protein C8J56DRAFT_917424 [Mycena floridula]|nr:hypothetical protein C8J56DRAFT_917424 [Mycena floridula]